VARTNHGRGRTRELAGVDEERIEVCEVVQEPGSQSGTAMHQAREPASNRETAYRARRHIGLDRWLEGNGKKVGNYILCSPVVGSWLTCRSHSQTMSPLRLLQRSQIEFSSTTV
jgi:hypothetical protein